MQRIMQIIDDERICLYTMAFLPTKGSLLIRTLRQIGNGIEIRDEDLISNDGRIRLPVFTPPGNGKWGFGETLETLSTGGDYCSCVLPAPSARQKYDPLDTAPFLALMASLKVLFNRLNGLETLFGQYGTPQLSGVHKLEIFPNFELELAISRQLRAWIAEQSISVAWEISASLLELYKRYDPKTAFTVSDFMPRFQTDGLLSLRAGTAFLHPRPPISERGEYVLAAGKSPLTRTGIDPKNPFERYLLLCALAMIETAARLQFHGYY